MVRKKLDPEIIYDIRERFQFFEGTIVEYAEKHSMKEPSMRNILRGQSYSDCGGRIYNLKKFKSPKTTKQKVDKVIKEADWSAKLCRDMRRCNAIAWRIVGQVRQASAIPDCYIAHKGRSFWVEFKGPTTNLTVAQALTIRSLNERGVLAVVVRHPNLILNSNEELLRKFDGTGSGLLRELHKHVEEESY